MTLFGRRLWSVFALLWLQRATRLLLRAGWLLGAGILAGWAMNQRWGWLPNSNHWLLLGAVPAGLSLLAIVLPLPHPARLAWRLDRLYGLDEQIATAWQVRNQPPHELSRLLAADAANLLPRVFRRVLWRGWNLMGDLVSALTIAVLYILVLGPSWTGTPAAPLQVERERLPLAGQDATAAALFPGSVPGLNPQQSASASGAGMGEGEPGDTGGAGDATQDARSAAGAEVLQELGAALAQEAATYNVGRALEDGDLETAATEMELLGDQLKAMAPETQQETGEKLGEAGEELASAGLEAEQQLAESLQRLGGSMSSGETPAQQQLDSVAADLRALADLPVASASPMDGESSGAGVGGASSILGDIQPLERITGAGDTLVVDFENAEGEGSLLQGDPDQRGEGTVSGSQDGFISGPVTVSGNLTPYQFPWQWRYVVSQYFTPR
jgi:hypothetical protein